MMKQMRRRGGFVIDRGWRWEMKEGQGHSERQVSAQALPQKGKRTKGY